MVLLNQRLYTKQVILTIERDNYCPAIRRAFSMKGKGENNGQEKNYSSNAGGSRCGDAVDTNLLPFSWSEQNR